MDKQMTISALSDEATAAEVIDSRAFSDFCGVDSINQVPDGGTIGRFRNLLIKNGLQEEPLLPAGTGISNIRAVAEKYHGAVLTEKTGDRFSLNVLLGVSAV